MSLRWINFGCLLLPSIFSNSDGTIRGLVIWSVVPECKNLGWSNPPPGPPAGSSDTSGLGTQSAPGPFSCWLCGHAQKPPRFPSTARQMKLPKAEHDAVEWQAAMEALLLVAESGGPTMFARIGVMRALSVGRLPRLGR